MRNTFLIIKREYLQRVRTKAFIIFTVLMPLFMWGVIYVPTLMINMKSTSTRHVVVVASSQATGDAIKAQLEKVKTQDKADLSRNDNSPAPTYTVDTNSEPSDELKKQLTAEVGSDKIDGYLWVTDSDIAARKFTYSTKHSSDFIDTSTVQSAVNNALMRTRLVSRGIAAEQVDEVLKRMDMDTVRIEKGGKESKAGGTAAFLLPFMLMFMIYMTLIIYGVSVMRSVLEEKTTRVVEVMLSSANSMQMMAGKILGVGAVGFTQILIWITSALVVSTPGILMAKSYLKDVQLAPMVFVCFPLFFVLGFLLYSTMYAAMGSMVNSEEEAQQIQWPVLMPLILCSVFATKVIQDPNSPLAFWASMFPLTSPIIMFVRVIVQQPPIWQIGLSVALLVLATWGMMWVCSRIYRVGILMYGKRPTLPEIMKWIKYA